MPTESPRLLFVDDEESIRAMLSAILEQHGFKVRTASSVPEALVEINAAPFDVLICDLNLDKPGDGFLVLAAMRHLHPECVNLILTGYPAFETALQAMHHQVDDYLVKPADIDLLLGTIQQRLAARKSSQPELPTRLADLLRDSPQLAAVAVEGVEHTRELVSGSVPREERLGHLSAFVNVIHEQLANHRDKLSEEQQRIALEYGKARKAERQSILTVVTEFQNLDAAIAGLIRNHLPSMAIAGLFYDYERVHKAINALMLKALEAYDNGAARRKTNKGSVASE